MSVETRWLKVPNGAIPIWVALCGAITAVLAPVYFATEADRAAQLREEQLVTHGIDTLLHERAKATLSATVWDEAVDKLDNAFDREWAEQNVGVYMAEAFGVDHVLIIDAYNRPLLAMDGTDPTSTANVDELSTRGAAMIRAVRKREAGLAPVAERLARGVTMSEPVYGVEVAMLGGVPHIVSAALVQPDFGAFLPRLETAPIILAAAEIDGSMLAALGDRLLLGDPRLTTIDAALPPGRARAPFRNVRGQTVAFIEWRAQAPAAQLIRHSLPPVIAVVTVLMLIAFLLRRRNMCMTENLRASEARATHLAYHDALTGLPNRRLFADRLEGALAQLRRDGVPFAVHCIDLDRFKEINDTFGHAAGDELIRAATRTLGQLCGPADTLARMGGDEFAILQAGVGLQTAGRFANQLIGALGAPIDLAVGRVFIGASIGIALIEDGVSDAAECLRQADLALYQAKEQGRRRAVTFDASMDQALRLRCEIREELRAALIARELTMVYQPQYRNDVLCGVEALVRWNHKERGPLSPGVFVPIAEESGLIEPLGNFTLRQAFLDSHALPSVMIGINVSAAQLRLPSFVDTVRSLVAETRVDARRVELEITEGLLLGDDPATKARLQDLRDLGFRIALDDFGTGYSSLSYLQRYPIDRIKIDRSFINNLELDGEADAVIAAIVRLARALRLEVIAEGVETDLQRIRLLAAGCHDFQGYLFGVPVALAELLTGAGPSAGAATDTALQFGTTARQPALQSATDAPKASAGSVGRQVA